MNTTISAIQGACSNFDLDTAIFSAGYKICSNFDKLDCSFNFSEAAMNHNIYKNPSTLEKTNKISSKIFFCELASLLGTAESLLYSALSNKKFLSIAQATLAPDALLFGVSLGALCLSVIFYAINYFAVKKLNQLTNPKEFVAEGDIRVRWGRPDNEKSKQMMMLSRAVMNIGILCLSPTNPFVAASAGFQIYSLIKSTQLKWFKFSYKKYLPHHQQINYITFKYFMPKFTTSQGDDCSICIEPNADTLICANHSLHLNCFPGWIKQKVDTLIDSIRIINRHVTKTRNFNSSGVYTHTTYHVVYNADLPKAKLPNCPKCRETPPNGELKVTVWDRKYDQRAPVNVSYV